jgi:hypothetical protein
LHLPFEASRSLNRSPKIEINQWIERNWDMVGEGFSLVVAGQKTVPPALMVPFRIGIE